MTAAFLTLVCSSLPDQYRPVHKRQRLVLRSIFALLVIGALALQGFFASGYLSRSSDEPSACTRSLDSFITSETPIALSNLLCNIGSGACASGAVPGVVIASPSKNEPNYFYTWTRDAALTFKCVVDTFVAGYNATLQSEIESYITAQAKIQTVSNPSGDFSNGAGLGEPKFNADESAFTENWGRPQRDGPALRATALIAYAQWLIANGYSSTASNVVWPIIQNDLAYVTQYWGQSGFDLWEEVNGYSFFTVAAQHRSLVEGAALAASLGKTCSNCAEQAPQILCFLQNFWSPSGYVVANINVNNGRTGKDANTLLGSIHTFDPNADCDAATFQPCSDRALANHKAVTDSFRAIYSINSGIAQGSAIAVGRYAEDTYMGGNPWYLNTLAAAEQLYDALYQWNRIGSITITSTSLAFWKDIYPSAAVGTYASSSSTYTALSNAVRTYADGYFKNAASYTPSNGALAEQYSRFNGAPLSATDLTWSYASFLTCSARRAGIMPATWGVSAKNVIPSFCNIGGARGSYTAAPVPTFPAGQTPNPGAGGIPTATGTMTGGPVSTSPAACTPAETVAVTFAETVTTAYGQTVKITGSISQLADWSANSAIALSAVSYLTFEHVWFVTINLPAGTKFEYKFVTVNLDGSHIWESGPNRFYTVPTGCATTALVSTTWR